MLSEDLLVSKQYHGKIDDFTKLESGDLKKEWKWNETNSGLMLNMFHKNRIFLISIFIGICLKGTN
jgi:hypothetical protein